MGTRSVIILKVRKEDIGKVKNFVESRLPIEHLDWSCYGEEKGEEKSVGVPLKCEYIGIYCHWDGYPKNGVGETLLKHFTNYDSVLNLILGGWCSSISEEGVRRYATRKLIEHWKDVAPFQADTKEMVANYFDHAFAYFYDEEKGGWFVQRVGNKSFKNLSECF